MITTLKAKFRAWLIDLVREAIRSENAPADPVELMRRRMPERPPVSYPMMQSEYLTTSTEIKSQPISIEPSFEQMQAEALKAQEKYYEPA